MFTNNSQSCYINMKSITCLDVRNVVNSTIILNNKSVLRRYFNWHHCSDNCCHNISDCYYCCFHDIYMVVEKEEEDKH